MNDLLNKDQISTINFVISPGSHDSFGDGPRLILPTGEKCLVMKEYRQIQFNEKPDNHGSIVMLNTPFFECPFIRVYLDVNGGFDHWEARQIPGYSITDSIDPLKKDSIYAWRMVANSLTGYNMTAPLNQAGSVTVANLPLSFDLKLVYQDVNSSNPIQYIRCLDYLPTTSAGIANITTSFKVSSAVEGSYVCLRHTDPSLPFVYRDSDMTKATFGEYFVDNGTDITAVNRTLVNHLAWSDQNFTGNFLQVNGQEMGVTYPSKMDLGITCFEGLDASATITFKGMAAWEFIPKMNSTKLNQCMPMSPKDDMFLDALNTAEMICASHGVAADNGFGSFIKGIVNKIADYTPMIKTVAAALPPQIGAVVNSVADAIPKVNTVVNALVKDNNANKSNINKINKTLSSSLITPSARGMRGKR